MKLQRNKGKEFYRDMFTALVSRQAWVGFIDGNSNEIHNQIQRFKKSFKNLFLGDG